MSDVMSVERIYLDNQATTPLDPAVLAAMLPYFGEDFGNPHSDEHGFGWRAASNLAPLITPLIALFHYVVALWAKHSHYR